MLYDDRVIVTLVKMDSDKLIHVTEVMLIDRLMDTLRENNNPSVECTVADIVTRLNMQKMALIKEYKDNQ